MPIVNVKVIENVFTVEQKREMITRITDALVAVEGENMRGVTWVYIEDVKEGQFAIGGNTLSAEDVHRMQQGEAAA
jgi:4-oxalocrotonate tautomerase